MIEPSTSENKSGNSAPSYVKVWTQVWTNQLWTILWTCHVLKAMIRRFGLTLVNAQLERDGTPLGCRIISDRAMYGSSPQHGSTQTKRVTPCPHDTSFPSCLAP